MKDMARKRLLGNMTEKKDVITDHAQEAIINQVSNILLRMRCKVSLKAWRKLLKIAEELDSDGTYNPTINAIRGAFDNNHPYPTHEGAESIINDPVLVNHLDNYSKGLEAILRERDLLNHYTEKKAVAN